MYDERLIAIIDRQITCSERAEIGKLLSYGLDGLPDRLILVVDNIAFKLVAEREQVFADLRRVAKASGYAFAEMSRAIDSAILEIKSVNFVFRDLKALSQIESVPKSSPGRSYDRFLPKPVGKQRCRK